MSDTTELHPAVPGMGKPAPARKAKLNRAIVDGNTTPDHALQIARVIAGGAAGGDHEPVLGIEQVVGIILRSCRRLGRRRARIQPVIAADLERHCRKGDPTALMLRDWLDGRGPLDLTVEAGVGVERPAAIDARERGRL